MITIKYRKMRDAKPKPGMKQSWIEVQVLEGRKVIGQYDSIWQAQQAHPEAIVANE